MPAILLAGPANEPVSVAELRQHLRLGDGEDALLGSLIAAARLTVEAQSGLRLIHQVWRMMLDDWPLDGLTLPVSPVTKVLGVRLLGDSVTALSPSDYRLERDTNPMRIYFIGNHLPRPQYSEFGIQLDFQVGFGAKADAVPEDLKLAVLKLAAHWYDMDDWAQVRGEGAVPPHVAMLVNAHRLPRL